MLSVSAIAALFYVLVAVYLVFFLLKNDEFLVFVLLFFYSAALSRYELILDKKAKYVFVAYAKNIFTMNDTLGLEALNLMFLGTVIFSLTYMALQWNYKPSRKKLDNDDMLKRYLTKNRTILLTSFGGIFIVNAIVSSRVTGSMAYGQSYFFYFGMAISGMILLSFLMFRGLSMKKDGPLKIFYLIIIALAGFTTYDQSTRFRFISWIAAIGIIVTKKFKPLRKLVVFSIGGIIAAYLFAFIGDFRIKKNSKFDGTFKSFYEIASKRLQKGEDSNMLDGMMMNIQVYPHHLDYTLGFEHVEILLRPIPRAWWPGKPLGGYHNKLGLNENMGMQTVGVSPSIYGTFFNEGGVLGILVFSVLYAWLFTFLFRRAGKYGSEMQFVIKGMVISSTIPWLRGGDLPGIIAFIGMTYWPVFIFLLRYGKWLKKERRKLALIEHERQLALQNQGMQEVNLLKLQQSLRLENLLK